MKSPDFMPIDVYLNDPSKAIQPLAQCLVDGTLALAIGAGASAPLGLPAWWELVNCCLTEAQLTETVDANTSNEVLRKKMDLVQRAAKDDLSYKELVRRCLYKDVEYSRDVIKQELLIALGALLMSSRRGSVRQVITLNFDDVLEWYLGLHGFDIQVVTDTPYLKRDADVTIFHPQGFLPKMGDIPSAGNVLILSQKSYDERLGEPFEPWREVFRQVLTTKFTLFVGLSGDDPTIGPSLYIAKKQLNNSRKTGFWLFGQPKSKNDRDHFVDRNVIPLCLNGHDQIPSFLLAVCQKAAELSRK